MKRKTFKTIIITSLIMIITLMKINCAHSLINEYNKSLNIYDAKSIILHIAEESMEERSNELSGFADGFIRTNKFLNDVNEHCNNNNDDIIRIIIKEVSDILHKEYISEFKYSYLHGLLDALVYRK